MKLLTLIEIEIKKILPWLLILFTGLTALSTGLFYRSISRENNENVLTFLRDSTVEEFVELHGRYTLTQIFDTSVALFLLYFAVALFIILLGFYLWYKEWFGQSKRIYMLLTLQGNRFTIVLSKLIVIVFSMFTYCGVILLNLLIGSALLNGILPEGIVADNLIQGLLSQSELIGFLLPLTMNDFFYRLAFIILMFGIITVFVFLDRSKRIFGFIFGAIYGIANVALFIYTQTIFLFVDERFFVNWGFVLGMSMLSYGISYWLLQKKVSI